MNDTRQYQTHHLLHRNYLLLWLIAFVPRLILALVFFQQSIALDDMYQYDMLARSMLQGESYRWYSAEDIEPLKPYYKQFLNLDKISFPEEGIKTAHRGPGYPAFLMGVYALVPETTRFGWTRIVQAVLTAGLAPLTALIAIYNGFNKRTAVLSGAVMGLYPILLFYPLALASENLFLFTLSAGFLCLLLYKRRGGWTPLILSILFLTASVLTRSVVILFILFSAAWLYTGQRKRISHSVLFLALIFALCLPWAVRNSRLMGKATFLETSLGYNLFISYHPEGNGGFISDIAIRPLRFIEDQAREAYTMRKARQFIQQDPWDAGLRIFRKTAFFFGLEDREMIYFYGNGFFGPIPQPWRMILYLVLVLPWVITLLFFPLGILLHRDRRAVLLTLGLMITYAVPHFLIIAEPRFHLALLPILLPYAARGWNQRRSFYLTISPARSRSRKLILLALTWAVLLILVMWQISLHWETLIQIMGPEGHNLHPTY